MDQTISCAECGQPIEPDSSPGVWLHDRALSANGYDGAHALDEDHSARPEDPDTPHPAEQVGPPA